MGKALYKDLGLTSSEYQEIINILKREPNNLELAMFSVMWSEHCCYKSSKQYLKTLPTKSPRVVVGPGENAGVLDIGDGLLLACRIESHNHPCAVEPVQGAATGVGGILRDIFTMGARPVALGDCIYVGPITNKNNFLKLEGIVDGISSYGNSVGVPTLGGELHFEECYSQNPLVNVFCLGLLKKEHLVLAKATGEGNLVVLLGAPTGKDGIGGVSILASTTIDSENQKSKLPAVQVGDPYEEKRLIEACLELFSLRLVVAIQDLGGAGLTCASSELAAKGSISVEINVDLVPLREPLEPYEIMTSESQERMLAIVEPKNLENVLEVAKKWEINAAVIGKLTKTSDEPLLIITNNEKKVLAKVPANAIASGPQYCKREVIEKARAPKQKNFSQTFSDSELKQYLLSQLINHEWVYSQYDHQLFLNTLVPPGHGAFLIRASAPLIGDYNKAIAVSLDGNPLWCDTDPELGTYLTLFEGALKVACLGATPIACVDCLNFGSPEDPNVMGDFVNCINGLKRACDDLGIPVIGGNVSFYNATDESQIYPTPVLGTIGLIDPFDGKLFSSRLDQNDSLYLVGTNVISELTLGGSKLAKAPLPLPKIDLKNFKQLLNFLIKINHIKRKHYLELFKTITPINQGGLALKVVELATINNIGITINSKLTIEELFCEAPGSVLVVTADDKEFELQLKEEQISFKKIGQIGGSKVLITPEFSLSLKELIHSRASSIKFFD